MGDANYNKTTRWQELGQYYDLSVRRLKPHAKENRIMGVTYERGSGFHFWGDWGTPYTMTGPVADVRQDFILPPGTIAIDLEIVPGEVQGRIYEIDLQLEPDRKKPMVTLMAEPGCSGAIVRIIAMASGMNSIISDG